MIRDKETLVNNLRINYKMAGEGKPLLILHGWGRGSDSWIQVQEILAEKKYKVIVPDLPGFGKSQAPATAWTVDDYATWLNDFIVPLNLEKIFLLGHSFGGRIAIKFAIKFPEKISKLILYEAAGIKHKKVLSQIIINTFAKIGNKFSFFPFYSTLEKAFYKFVVRKQDYLRSKGIMKETFKKVISQDLTPFLPLISVPTVIIWGEKDKITPLSDAYLMKEKIIYSEIKIIPALGHGFHHEAPENLTNTVVQFTAK